VCASSEASCVPLLTTFAALPPQHSVPLLAIPLESTHPPTPLSSTRGDVGVAPIVHPAPQQKTPFGAFPRPTPV
jgi:hypothetical protein